jgi:hypothetical protein
MVVRTRWRLTPPAPQASQESAQITATLEQGADDVRFMSGTRFNNGEPIKRLTTLQ